jgi:isopentenyl phosphate kinase
MIAVSEKTITPRVVHPARCSFLLHGYLVRQVQQRNERAPLVVHGDGRFGHEFEIFAVIKAPQVSESREEIDGPTISSWSISAKRS